MYQNYLVIAFRNILRHKLFSFINIAGLAVGLACAMFIVLFLRDDLSYDAWIPDSKNLYRVESSFNMPGGGPHFASFASYPVTPTMREEIPDVVAQTHLIPENTTAQIGDRQFPVTVDAVDPNFFQVIRLPLIEGNPENLLAQPESIVLSQESARKFFGTLDAVGKTVMLRGSLPLIVTGVFRDLPHNTHLSVDLVMPINSKAESLGLATLKGDALQSEWLNLHGSGYVKLSPHANLQSVEEKLTPMLDKHIDAKKALNLNKRGSDLLRLHLTPFRYVHIAPFGETEAGRWDTVYGFAAIALLIVLIACINYMNLATARAMTRAREVSLRKVMGARRSQLIAQFMGESVITALVAVVLAFAAVEILLPAFDSLVDRPITYHIATDWPITVGILAVAILTGVLGGIYPAFLLSGFRPAATLGTSGSGTSGSGLLRTGLVVLQFAISIGLGIAVIVIFAQLSYSREIDMGFDRHNLLVINGAGSLSPSGRDSLTQALASDPAIAGVAQSDFVPFDGGGLVTGISVPQGLQNIVVRHVDLNPEFLNVYGMKLLAGRNLSRTRGTDIARDPDPQNPNPGENILINAAAARQFGYTVANAVGQTIFAESIHPLHIVGVVGNANFDGLQTEMQPFYYFWYPARTTTLSVRIKPGKAKDALIAVDRIWHRYVPSVAIRRRFQDASFDRLFIADEREGEIFGIFAGIAIFIACLGLFGLVAFTAERRTKEIGIRKTFGAKTKDMVLLLLWQFSIPVLIGNAIAWPVAWYYLHGWLDGFAYRIALSPVYFLVAGVAALVIALATVFVHALRVARANPIHALRYE